MTNFIEVFKSNLIKRKTETIATSFGHVVLIGALLPVIYSIIPNFALTLLVSLSLVLITSYKIVHMSWFWKGYAHDPKPAKKLVEEASFQPKTEDAAPAKIVTPIVQEKPDQPTSTPFEKTRIYGSKPRSTPVGTSIKISSNGETATLSIKVAIRFWCWALPGIFAALAIPAGLMGAIAGAISNQARGYANTDPIASALLSFVVCMGIALICHYVTRPTITVRVDDKIVAIGSDIFDRRFFGGMIAGYSSNETELARGVMSPRFGVVALAIQYGQWSEATKYMVDAQYANDIVTWVNDVINDVGVTDAKDYDPFVGKKIELL